MTKNTMVKLHGKVVIKTEVPKQLHWLDLAVMIQNYEKKIEYSGDLCKVKQLEKQFLHKVMEKVSNMIVGEDGKSD